MLRYPHHSNYYVIVMGGFEFHIVLMELEPLHIFMNMVLITTSFLDSFHSIAYLQSKVSSKLRRMIS